MGDDEARVRRGQRRRGLGPGIQAHRVLPSSTLHTNLGLYVALVNQSTLRLNIQYKTGTSCRKERRILTKTDIYTQYTLHSHDIRPKRYLYKNAKNTRYIVSKWVKDKQGQRGASLLIIFLINITSLTSGVHLVEINNNKLNIKTQNE